MNNITKKRTQKINLIEYSITEYSKFDYSLLSIIPVKKEAGKRRREYNDIIIMGDTETSKKTDTGEILSNHVCAWSLSLRSHSHNIVTLYGRKPSELVKCIDELLKVLKGQYTFIFFHNLSYDWVFLRKFMIKEWGEPESQLNVKSHYPIYIGFRNGIILRDSLILSQRNLEKWAKDLNIEHQKAVGKWDYDLIRNQDTPLNENEIEYVSFDTLSGVECIEATMKNLNKRIYSIPYTATGISRERVRKIGKRNNAHSRFKSQALDYEQLKIAEAVYHGGFTHANRHYLSRILTEKEHGLIQCYDFASSYPYTMITGKFPIEKFTPFRNCSIAEILKESDKFAFMFHLVLLDVRLKNDEIVMPTLQFSKCDKVINGIYDNGRILKADYVSIWITEIDLKLIYEQYQYTKHLCTNVMYARKDNLPKWFTDFIFKCFEDKTQLKGGDPVLYALSKTVINALYGMCCQHPVKEKIIEDYLTGSYEKDENQNMEDEYDKYVKRFTSILPYQWGVWVTAYAMENLFKLGKCCDTWIYSDTDSCYGIGWDKAEIERYNNSCRELIKSRGYGGVKFNNREYWLGIAEHEEKADDYTEFVTLGAKRYCGRNLKDGKLHITVAGVPKKGVLCLKDDINNFRTGLIFSGSVTGKLTHTYIFVDDIYIDENGNETGDSIDLSPCDYLLQAENYVRWEDIINESVSIQTTALL